MVRPAPTPQQGNSNSAANVNRQRSTPTPIPFNVTLNGTACHLHDAITAANGDTATGSCPAGSGADTITLTADITLSASLPKITSTITIEGADHFISGNNTYRILYIEEAGNLTINQLQLKHGSGHVGGAILNYFGTLAVTNSRFDSNSAGAFGGAIGSVGGTTTISSSSFSNNSSAYMAGALYTGNLGRLTVTSSTLSSNSADNFGGAIAVSGHATINSSKLNDNSSPKGGAIWNSALSYINNSEISNNSSTRDGGAIYASGNTLTVTNSTITGNSASRHGGAVFVQKSIASVYLKHVTVANNSAANGGGVYKEARATLNLRNSIVAGSTSGGDCVGGLDGNVNNLIQDNSCSPSVSGDPLLGTLTGSPAYYPLLERQPGNQCGSALITARTLIKPVKPDPGQRAALAISAPTRRNSTRQPQHTHRRICQRRLTHLSQQRPRPVRRPRYPRLTISASTATPAEPIRYSGIKDMCARPQRTWSC